MIFLGLKTNFSFPTCLSIFEHFFFFALNANLMVTYRTKGGVSSSL